MNGGDNSERGDRGDKSGSGAEAVRKRRRDKDGTRTGLLGSARERDWVVGSQILTKAQDVRFLGGASVGGIVVVVGGLLVIPTAVYVVVPIPLLQPGWRVTTFGM